MHFRKVIFSCLILAVFMAQFSIAQHEAVHPDHVLNITLNHQIETGQEDPDQHKQPDCAECLLTKTLQTAFYNSPSLITVDFPLLDNVFLPVEAVKQAKRFTFYHVRAPPLFLI
tara:strand:+ start:2208 stop:2549 length:342 start_codon:yes stop_codon:yes gene_type:complete